MESFAEARQRCRFGLESPAAIGLAVLLVSLISGVGAATALAAPAQLWQRCDSAEPAGQQCSIPRGIAADPESGHVFIADSEGRRIVELTATGTFVKTWGWDVVESGPDNAGTGFEICIPAKGDICKAGLEGSGAGQLGGPQGVALDSSGDVYVVDWFHVRVQKFDPEGNFLLMFGDEVDQGPNHPGDVCTAGFIAEGDNCGAGDEGTAGGGQFSWPIKGSFIAIDDDNTPTAADDTIYVGDQQRIQTFDTGGLFLGEVPQDPAGLLKEKTVQSLAVGASGDLFLAYRGAVDVRKLNPISGEELAAPRFEVSTPEGPAEPAAVAVDPAGHVWAFGPTSYSAGLQVDPIWEFDSEGNVIDNFGKGEFGDSTGLATNLCPGDESPGDLYVSNSVGAPGAFVRAYGTPPTNCGKAITGKASNIEETTATLNGKANPKGLAVTECVFEYGLDETYGETAPCAESSGAIGTGNTPVPVHADIAGLSAGTVYHFRLLVATASGTEAGSDETFKTLGPPVISEDHLAGATDTEATLKALVNPEGLTTTYHFEYGLDETYGQSTPTIPVGKDRTPHPVLANLAGLAPATTYHWRIAAVNASGETEGADHTLTTYRTASPDPSCPNQAFRTGASALLPDCRAYEMVSPVAKNGGDIVAGLAGAGDPGGNIQATADGDRITYTSLASFGDEPNYSGFNQYLASREAGVGWSTHGIHPAPAPNALFGFSREFIAFSSDLCSAWLVDGHTPALIEDAQVELPNLYRRDDCGAATGSLEAVTAPPLQLPPPPATDPNYVGNTSVQGTSDDSRHVLFVARAPLTADAALNKNAQVYDHFGGANHLVSVLPGGTASPGPSAVGNVWGFTLDHAISSDGSRVYWMSNFAINQGTGKLFVREHPEQGAIGTGEECEAAKACTIPVSAGLNAFFWGAAANGSKAIYSEGEDLFQFDLGTEASTLIAHHVKGVAGASDDLSRIYLVSSDALAAGATAGQPNIYLDEAGTLTLVATLLESDIGQKEPGASIIGYDVAAKSPYFRPTRVTPDGAHIAFESRAPLTGFDNREEANGKAAVEVFAYEAGGELVCVSCNPSGARPRGQEMQLPYSLSLESGTLIGPSTKVTAAAWIPTWEHSLRASNVLSDDGGRLFFNSNDALLPRDGNGAQDVYEWEAPGVGRCTEASPSFQPANDGCLYLISSGESSFGSEFWEATPNGHDVFFNTASSLLPQDPGLVDLYDARVEGGFPQPLVKAACEGEACQSPPPPPNDPTPASATYSGPGNEPAGKPHCRRGTHRVRRHGKARCVKNRHGNKHRAGHKRGAGR
jgi:DNA-binding beta-propeller fold protein YncE